MQYARYIQITQSTQGRAHATKTQNETDNKYVAKIHSKQKHNSTIKANCKLL